MSLVNYSVEVSAHWQKWATAWLSAFQTEVVISFYFTDQITLKIKTKLSDYLFRWSHYETTKSTAVHPVKLVCPNLQDKPAAFMFA